MELPCQNVLIRQPVDSALQPFEQKTYWPADSFQLEIFVELQKLQVAVAAV